MKEVRFNDIDANVNVSTREVCGYAAVFNSESRDLGGFTEIILPNAFDGVIERSDVLALFDHDKQRGALARCKNGQGSLHLTVDNIGLRFNFELPNTQLGNEVYEYLRRGDVNKCSFAFVCEEDKWEKRNDGSVVRYIVKIKRLLDTSICFFPAYEGTCVNIVNTRSYDDFIEGNNNENNQDKPVAKRELKKDSEELMKAIDAFIEKYSLRSAEQEEEQEEEKSEDEEETPKDEESPKEEEETKSEEEPKDEDTEEKSECEDEDEETKSEEEPKEEENEDRNLNNINITKNKMENFSLIKAIRSVAEGRKMDETSAKVIAEGRSEMAKAGLSANGQIVLPTSEVRADNTNGQTEGVFATVAKQGVENVGTDLLGIVEPLRNALVTNGFTYMNGLKNDIEIPYYSGSNCGWAGETEAAMNAAGEWSKIKMQPKRLTAFLDISKLFLAQDSNSAEEMLRRDLVNALREKLEMTIFGDEAGDANKPAGLFNGVVANTAALKYDDMVDYQAELAKANINGAKTIICSPSAYAALRLLKLDAGSGRFYLEGNQTVDGINVVVSNSVVDKGMILGDFAEMILAQWSGIDVTVDTVTRAAYGQVRLVINAYFDCAARRPEAFVAKILK